MATVTNFHIATLRPRTTEIPLNNFLAHGLVWLTRSVTLTKQTMISQSANILLTSNSKNSITLDGFRSGRSLSGDKGGFSYYVRTIGKLHLCSLLERFQNFWLSSQVSAVAGTSESSPQPLPINYQSTDNSYDHDIEVPEDAPAI